MDKLPSGTITFLFTDIEGSTKRWEEQPEAMAVALAKHDVLLRGIFEGRGGYVFKTIGDAFCVAFARATEAVAAAVQSQRSLYREEWGVTGGIRVRMALHTGMAEERDGDYFGPAVNRVARLLSAGHGGQILMSLTTEELANGALPAGARLEDMGDHELKDLQRPEHIFQLHIGDLPEIATPLKTLNNRPHNLPLQNTAFIGREAQVQVLKEQLMRADVRLLTLTGLGGTGKTRLSLRIGADLIDDFADGVFFVALANEQESGSVMSVIAQTLGIRESDGRTLLDSLKDALKTRQMLLILDNFEQVLGANRLVSTLIPSCPKLKLLVTSRAALRIYGEKEYAVPPMSLPRGRRKMSVEELLNNESVQLFLNRAQAVKPEFELNAQNAATIAQICSKLDGLPLALELAAARIRLLTPQAMLARLESRLKILTGGAKDLPARQQTLRGAIDWSYDLLNEADRALFCRLAVFAGGCTLEAMESVCIDGDIEIDVLNETESLVSKSLLRQETQDDGEPRFTMLETVREYALEKLTESGECNEMQGRHVAYYLKFAEEAESKLGGEQQATWLNLLEAEHDNMRAALSWALENSRVEEALRLAGALSRFWVLRSYFTEGRRRLAEALAVTEPHNMGSYDLVVAGVADSEEDVRGYIAESIEALNRVLTMNYPGTLTESAMLALAKALNGAGNLSHRQGDYVEARRLYMESMAIRQKLGDAQGIAASFNNLASVAYRQGDLKGACAMYQESLAIKKEKGDNRAVSSTLNNLGIIAQEMGNPAEARQLYMESLAIRRKLGDKQGTAVSLEGLGVLAFEAGEYGKARLYLEECLQLRRDLNDRQGIAHALHDFGNLLFAEERYEQARQQWHRSLLLKQDLNDKEGIAASLEAFARLGAASGGIEGCERALRLGAAADKLRESIGAPRSAQDERRFATSIEVAQKKVRDQAVEAIVELGEMMTLQDAVAYALRDSGGDEDDEYMENRES